MKLSSITPIVLAIFLALTACDPNNETPGEFVYYDTGSGVIGANGGEVYVIDSTSTIKDANLHINAGVLTASSTFSIVQAPSSIAISGHPYAIIVDIQPSTISFATEVVVGLSYRHLGSVDLNSIQIFRYIPSSGELIPLDRPNPDDTKKVLYGSTTKLGYFVILEDTNLQILSGEFTDTRDQNTYNWVQINGQKWMSENLAFETASGSYCYDGVSSNCNTYGRLYDQITAASACPEGWHLPEHSEWKTLERTLGMTENEEDVDGWKAQGYIGEKLKASSGWDDNGNGTDIASFKALPAGFRDGDGTFSTKGLTARFWTNTRENDDYWARFLYGDQKGTYWAVRGGSRAYSVRCIEGENDDIPQVKTTTPTAVTGLTAEVGGDIISQGNSSISDKGICWNDIGYPLHTDNSMSFGNGTSSFSSMITGLKRATTYYFRAYAINSDGVGYGEEKSITTSSLADESGIFTDSRDNKSYEMVEIGGVWWMAENLNFGLQSGTWCYNDDNDNCSNYGRLYNWQTATSICPPGWILPSDEDWQAMEVILGMTEDDAKDVDWRHDGDIALRLRSQSGWYNNNNGNNESALTFKPAGFREGGGDYNHLTEEARFWTATTNSSGNPYVRYLEYNNDGVYRETRENTIGLSVRCIKGTNDDLPTVATITPYEKTGFTAQVGGNVSSQGKSSVNERGVCWIVKNGDNIPSIYDNKIELGKGTGPFELKLTGLSIETSYIVRAYAISDEGISYGDTKEFETDSYTAVVSNMTDTRDGQNYETVKISGHWWLSENLNYESTEGSWCYDDNPDNCDKYGRLYDWDSADIACPDGWELASDSKWKEMEIALGMTESDSNDDGWRNDGQVGIKMKSSSGWSSSGNGNNQSQFNGLPAGYRDADKTFKDMSKTARFWTSTDSGDNAWARYLEFDQEGVERAEKGKERGMAVRCVKK